MSRNSNIKVLIVDDSRTERFYEEKALSGLGCDVETAVDGTDALKFLLQKGPVDLILLDLKMPRMDGHEFLAELRKNCDLRHIKVIVLSAQTEEEVMPVLKEGAHDYWLKGSHVVVLKSKVSNLIYMIQLEKKLERIREIAKLVLDDEDCE
ncbi:Response regulator [Sulfidibacter corallicola]|uniref:Response regulator n=1 Tax=Sulfidibacter corallicola TaxID=2818388 RepID=A0A8A4TT91_SULCO|nr:response regulator [Sulfidibacter corallicola]QTD52374.1 response regulator [Sulfidibacter corallicola]